MKTTKRTPLQKRHRRVRKKVIGSAERPRLAVFRSNRHIYAQVIDDEAGRTLAAASSLTAPAGSAGGPGGKTSNGEDPKARAKAVGVQVAEKAKAAGIERVTFDRGGFRYHGRVQALADGAREGGLEF
ncbi:MAG: 50S ribosomal protein L18 [Actinomycetota bacterium]|nr:50S ribosomal protein L18 [Actinomycetota bacterium]